MGIVSHRHLRPLLGASLIAGLAVAVAPLDRASAGDAAPLVTVVSGDAAKVTGGDALVDIVVHDRGAARHLRVSDDGRDVTAAFTEIAPLHFRGLVGGLDDGDNLLVARTNGRGEGTPPGRSASATLTNHPISGPVFSGPHQQPFFCETVQAGLGPALDANCFAPTQVVYRYRTTGGSFAPLADPGDRPADLATVEIGGVELPYIVRIERGVINRGLYEIAALHDAADPSPLRDEAGWNGRLIMTFGGGCNVGYHQGSSTAGVLDHAMLSRGYAIASSSLLINDNNCNPVLAAETAMMVKERVIEVYGPLAHTIGWGGSGGAIMQHTITHAYPGLLDGLIPQASYADALSVVAPSECVLLLRYFATPTGSTLTPAQRSAIDGHRNPLVCLAWQLTFANRIDATSGCPAVVAANAVIYDPVDHPDGVRCALSDHLVNILGTAADGFAPALFDNVGLQYGLGALNDGVISVDQFLELNEHIGGYDRDGLPQAERSIADPAAIERVYSTGLITSGHGGLAYTPTIDVRFYTDQQFDIHMSYWSVAIHERLVRDGADPRIHARWIYNGGSRPVEALDVMEEWLNAIAADGAPGTPAERAVRNRPAAASDGCWPTPTSGKVEDLDACYSGPFPFAGDPRTVAGAPRTVDVAACQRKAPSPDDYAVAFTSEQWDRLLAAFPLGVCDYDVAGIGQVPIAGTWQEF
jgi:hypothetical protein